MRRAGETTGDSPLAACDYSDAGGAGSAGFCWFCWLLLVMCVSAGLCGCWLKNGPIRLQGRPNGAIRMTLRGLLRTKTLKMRPLGSFLEARALKMEPEGTQKRKSGTLKNHEKHIIVFIRFSAYWATREPPRGAHKTQKDTKRTQSDHREALGCHFGNL